MEELTGAHKGKEKKIDYSQLDNLIEKSQIYIDGIQDRMEAGKMSYSFKEMEEAWVGKTKNDFKEESEKIHQDIQDILKLKQQASAVQKYFDSYEGPRTDLDQSRISQLLDIKSILENTENALGIAARKLIRIEEGDLGI